MTKEECSRYQVKWAREHRGRVNDYRDARRKRYRAIIREIKTQRGCSQCGEGDPRCLDFHHVTGEKEFAISHCIATHGLDRLLSEIAKCDVLCANCHRKEHGEEEV